MTSVRQRRVADQIRSELSDLLLRDVRDPRLSFVTITDVSIDRELAYAQVYVNALGEEDRQDEVMEALDRARGYLRSQIASRIRLRRTPDLRFYWDPSLQHGERISELLDSLHQEEE
ncbi:MAG: 30S ribosome-binding factor RbfA [Chloroflexota bacterium]